MLPVRPGSKTDQFPVSKPKLKNPLLGQPVWFTGYRSGFFDRKKQTGFGFVNPDWACLLYALVIFRSFYDAQYVVY
jgi:hypothetical protein